MLTYDLYAYIINNSPPTYYKLGNANCICIKLVF